MDTRKAHMPSDLAKAQVRRGRPRGTRTHNPRIKRLRDAMTPSLSTLRMPHQHTHGRPETPPVDLISRHGPCHVLAQRPPRAGWEVVRLMVPARTTSLTSVHRSLGLAGRTRRPTAVYALRHRPSSRPLPRAGLFPPDSDDAGRNELRHRNARCRPTRGAPRSATPTCSTSEVCECVVAALGVRAVCDPVLEVCGGGLTSKLHHFADRLQSGDCGSGGHDGWCATQLL